MNTSKGPSVNGGKRTSLTMRMKPALQNARLRTKLTNAPLVIALTILVVLMTVVVSACYDNTQEANQHSTVMPTSELGSATKGDSELDKPTPEATATPEPTETPIPNDWYVDERGHIPTYVEMLMPADSRHDWSNCLTRTAEGELVCQMWTKGELQKEWKLPEEILEVGDFKTLRASYYTDEVGQEVLSCFLDIGDGINVLGPNQATRVYYLQKGNEEFLVEYNSYYCELNQKYFTTPDGQFLYVLSNEDGSITIYSWQLSQGSYIDFDLEACVYAVFDNNGNKIGYLPTLRSDDSFPQPFDEPVTPPWGAIQD